MKACALVLLALAAQADAFFNTGNTGNTGGFGGNTGGFGGNTGNNGGSVNSGTGCTPGSQCTLEGGIVVVHGRRLQFGFGGGGGFGPSGGGGKGVCNSQRKCVPKSSGGGSGGSQGGGGISLPGGDAMANALACGEKLAKLCCSDATFRRDVCEPYHYCKIAVGKAPQSGPMICPPPKIPNLLGGKKGKCDKPVAALKDTAKQSFAKCVQSLEPLYKAQRNLVDCVHVATQQKKQIEKQKKKVSELSKQSNECQTKKSQKSKAVSSSLQKKDFCPAHRAQLQTALVTFTTEVAKCMMSHSIKLPEIKVPSMPPVPLPTLNPSFQTIPVNSINVPKFSAHGFNPAIVVPGGGPKLNAPPPTGGQKQKLPTLKDRLTTVNNKVNKCEDTKTKLSAVQPKVVKSVQQAQTQHSKSCASGRRRLRSAEAQKVIRDLTNMKRSPMFACSSTVSAIDSMIGVLKLC